MILKTNRLYLRKLRETDESLFCALMSNANVMNLVPQKVLNKKESAQQLKELIEHEKTSDTKIWALCKLGEQDMIGFAGLLKNNAAQDEIAYRILEEEWGRGYGTEITGALIDFCFNELNSNYVTADVWIENIRSIKIIEKFMNPTFEFFNAHDKCTDRRYELRRKNWEKRRSTAEQ